MVTSRRWWAWRMCALALCFLSCQTSAHFIPTTSKGAPSFDPLSPDEDVHVFNSGPPQVPYVELGVVRVSGGSLERQIQEARRVARRRGGNGLVLVGSKDKRGTWVKVRYEETTFALIRMERPAEDPS